MLLGRQLCGSLRILAVRRMDPPATPVYHAVVEKPSPALPYVVIGSHILVQRSSGISREDLGVQIVATTGAANSKNLSRKRFSMSFRRSA